MGKIAFVFAGQGAQYPGMGKELYDFSPAARQAFDLAESMRPGTIKQCFSGNKEELMETVNTQPCLFVTDYACAAALREAGVAPAGAAGFSLGEVAAAAFCKILSYQDAFHAVCKRGEYMQACAEQYPGSMAAVLKLSAEQVEALAGQFTGVFPVNYNCPGQTVVAGLERDMPQFCKAVAEQGGRALPLKVSGAFHSPLMEDASQKLYSLLLSRQVSLPSLPLYANVSGLPYLGDAAQLLANQVKSPVRWQKTVENMLKDGYDTFIEVGAGKTLSGLISKIGGARRICNVCDLDSLKETLSKVKNQEVR